MSDPSLLSDDDVIRLGRALGVEIPARDAREVALRLFVTLRALESVDDAAARSTDRRDEGR